ncbi:hypothetical protein L0244_34515 [bacterium]|nr:hypothetical protein [bacterium]
MGLLTNNYPHSVISAKKSDELRLDIRLWHGSFNKRESTLHQLAPYVGKLKSGMARCLLQLYSKPGDLVLDPFSGSGVVPLEAILLGRQAWAIDLNPYAYVLTHGKLDAPFSIDPALAKAESILAKVEGKASSIDLRKVPLWIRRFFHPNTLRELLIASQILQEKRDFFLLSCLLGILHHQRPGFLSYPASHLVPYLRNKKYPPDKYPEMYQYRDLRSRLMAKIQRAYRNHMLPSDWKKRQYKVWRTNSMNMPIANSSVNVIITSPPYFKALDYARDNRLRLWFLGCKDWEQLENSLTTKAKVYLPQMGSCLQEMYRVLKPKSYCVLVLGDVERNGTTKRTAEILAEMAMNSTHGGFQVESIHDDFIPDERRARRGTRTTRIERILVMRKK